MGQILDGNRLFVFRELKVLRGPRAPLVSQALQVWRGLRDLQGLEVLRDYLGQRVLRGRQDLPVRAPNQSRQWFG